MVICDFKKENQRQKGVHERCHPADVTLGGSEGSAFQQHTIKDSSSAPLLRMTRGK
jgi:hypothetical protein